MAAMTPASTRKDVWGRLRVRIYQISGGWTDGDHIQTDLRTVHHALVGFNDASTAAADAVSCVIQNDNQVKLDFIGTARAVTVVALGSGGAV